ncbi:hypothetical protein CR513_52654, partial [Mucuna pruriens]
MKFLRSRIKVVEMGLFMGCKEEEKIEGSSMFYTKGEPRIELKENSGDALMLYFMDKSTAENKALEEHGEIHMFAFDPGGMKAILSCSGPVGLDILLLTTRPQKGPYFSSHKLFTLRTRSQKY